MGAEYRRGSMSAWLLKKKSGSAMVRMRQYNKRYFTIDFDSHVFFYSHAEGSKKVSSVIRFSDIADVRLPDPHGGAGGTESTSTTGERRGSKLLRSFSGLSGGGSRTSQKDGEHQAHHFVVVVVKPSMKTMELLCSTSMEAEQWHQALREAMLYSKDLGDEVGACVATTDSMSGDEEGETFRTVALSPPTHETTSPSVARTADRKPPGPVGASAVATAKAALATPTPKPALSAPQRAQEKTAESASIPLLSGGYPTNASDTSAPPIAQKSPPTVQSSPEPEVEVAPTKETQAAPRVQQSTAPLTTAAPTPAPAATSSPVAAPARTPAPSKVERADDDTAPPPQKGTFLDLSTEPLSTEAVTAPSHGGYAGRTGVEAVQEVVVETGGLLQQSDFGFEAGEDTESSGSAVSTPREGAAKTLDGNPSPTPKPDVVTSSSPQAEASTVAGTSNGRFGDRDRGLSMQERLQNLEFSDDEEYDDDDPLGLKSKSK